MDTGAEDELETQGGRPGRRVDVRARPRWGRGHGGWPPLLALGAAQVAAGNQPPTSLLDRPVNDQRLKKTRAV